MVQVAMCHRGVHRAGGWGVGWSISPFSRQLCLSAKVTLLPSPKFTRCGTRLVWYRLFHQQLADNMAGTVNGCSCPLLHVISGLLLCEEGGTVRGTSAGPCRHLVGGKEDRGESQIRAPPPFRARVEFMHVTQSMSVWRRRGQSDPEVAARQKDATGRVVTWSQAIMNYLCRGDRRGFSGGLKAHGMRCVCLSQEPALGSWTVWDRNRQVCVLPIVIKGYGDSRPDVGWGAQLS